MHRIGFIGLGSMGSRMARRLLDAGHELTVYDSNPTVLARFAGIAGLAPHPAGCADTDAVIVMVANDAQAEDALLGPEGLLAGIDPVASPVVVVMSTVLPQTVRKLAHRLAEKNCRMLDAPVSGGLSGAEAGTLSLMVGGAKAELDALRPIFAVIGRHVFHCGELSYGVATKIVNNVVGVTNLFLMAEVSRLAERYQLDAGRLAEIMEVSSGRTFYTRDWNRARTAYGAIAQSAEAMAAHLDICRKDLACAMTMAREVKLRLPLCEEITASIASQRNEELQGWWQRAFATFEA
jgi:3-hydroxyisobutyrate dehydrogenase